MKVSFDLTGLYVWKNTVALGYPCLESFLSTIEMVDRALICVDPSVDEVGNELCGALADKFPHKTRLIYFRWPETTPDGSAIGIATQYALAQVTTSHAVNIQADEVWSPPLTEWVRDFWKDGAMRGMECLRFKVLHTEFNAQQFQGGEPWNGIKDMSEGSPWQFQKGAGYNMSVKLFKHCPAIRFNHDGWSVEGCATLYHCGLSDQFPIIHLHDFFRDHYIALRKNAGYVLWTDQVQYGYYRADADRIEATREQWWDDPKWTNPNSPFKDLLPWFAQDLIGKTRYEVNWKLLEEW